MLKLKVCLAAVFLILISCASEPEKSFDLKRVSFKELPGWRQDSLTEAMPALLKSCAAPSPEWENFCDGLLRVQDRPDRQIRTYLEAMLVPYEVHSYGHAQGTFTGYYEASLHGSFIKDEKNNVPLYGLPEDLVKLDTKTVCSPGGDKGTVMGRIENGKFQPYLTRAEIEQQSVNAPVLLWVDNAVDAFILHIQGSGRVETEQGVVHVGYAGNNGHPFQGIGGIMAKEGLLEPGKSSMPHIRAWLQQNPEKAQDLMAQNPRFIFFRILPEADGPMGAAGVTLTPERSLAVDPRFIPLGTPLYLVTTDPDGQSVEKLVVAQDIGSAIKGAVRGDYFWGYGEKAFQKAGRMKSSGRYYLLWPKGQTPPTSF